VCGAHEITLFGIEKFAFLPIKLDQLVAQRLR